MWIKKQVKEDSLEIENLKYLLGLNLKIFPKIKDISQDSYMIQKCSNVSETDFSFSPHNFGKLYFELLAPLYKFKKESFTPGVYKFFTPSSPNCKIKSQKYIPYVTAEISKIIRCLEIHIPKLLEDPMFLYLVNMLNKNHVCIKNWVPVDGYSLLHGDLHPDNMVKNGKDFLLIDYEYLRFGPSELEVCNLILCLLYHYKKKHKENISKLFNDYILAIKKLPFDIVSFPFFMVLVVILFYINFYIKKDPDGLNTVQKIILEIQYAF